MSDSATPATTTAAASTGEASSATSTAASDAQSSAAANESGQSQQPDYSSQKFKIKVDENDRELSYDEMVRYAQKGFGADKRFDEASSKEKQLSQFYSALQKDFKGTVRALATQLNVDPAELALDLMEEFNVDLEEKQRQAALTPEQRELAELRRDKEERARREAEAKEKEETETKQTAYEAKKKEHYQTFAKQIGDALDKVSFVKGDSPAHQAFYDQAVAMAAQKIQSCIEKRIPYDVQDIAEHVNESIKAQLNMLFSIEDDSLFGSYIPETLLKRVGKYYYNKLNPSAQAKPVEKTTEKQASSKSLHYSEYLKTLG